MADSKDQFTAGVEEAQGRVLVADAADAFDAYCEEAVGTMSGADAADAFNAGPGEADGSLSGVAVSGEAGRDYVSWSDFTHIGSWRVPITAGQNNRFYGSECRTCLDETNMVFYMRQNLNSLVATITPPADDALVISDNQADLPFGVITGDGDPADGYHTDFGGGMHLSNSGLVCMSYPYVAGNNRLWWNQARGYNTGGWDGPSFGVCDLDFGNRDGQWDPAGHHNKTSGYMSRIDEDWANFWIEGKAALCGEGCVSGAANSSWGPAAYAIAPWGATTPGQALASKTLVLYDIDHKFPLTGCVTEEWNLACGAEGASSCWITHEYRHSLLFSSYVGIGKYSYDEKPCAPPYQNRLWFFDAQDLIDDTVLPWQRTPKEEIILDDSTFIFRPGTESGFPVVFDFTRSRLYIVEPSGDDTQSAYEKLPVVHVLEL